MQTSTRRCRRNNTKRTILGVVNEHSVATEANLPEDLCNGFLSKGQLNRTQNEDKNGEMFEIPPDFDGSSTESVKILLQDIEHKLKKLQESIHYKSSMLVEQQKDIYFVAMMNVPRNIKNMTVRDFNKKYLEEGEDIIKLIGTIAEDAHNNQSNKKRFPNGDNTLVERTTAMEFKTPLRNIRPGAEFRTPGTLMRTIKRGEILYSIDGSPVDQTETGDLVATVSKKTRGNDAAVFDINVGDGRYISLSNPSSIQNLDPEMKSTAKTQLKVMQDQMTMLMAKLGN